MFYDANHNDEIEQVTAEGFLKVATQIGIHIETRLLLWAYGGEKNPLTYNEDIIRDADAKFFMQSTFMGHCTNGPLLKADKLATMPFEACNTKKLCI